jgi:glycosyltransferase involved in cell wall biosynthesis
MDISLLISTHQRGHLLKQSLNRLMELTLPAELVVVDDGGDDDTPEIVAEFGARSGVETTYVYTHNPGPQLCSHSRNVGIKRARHDWIVTSEPELCFRSDALALYPELQSQHPGHVISSGRVWFAPDGAAPVFEGEPNWELAHLWTAPHSALWHRDWLLAVGGWDETFPGPWGWDDTDLLTRLRLSGHGQWIAPEIEAVHLFHGLGGDTDSQNEKHFLSKSFNADESDLTDLVANKESEWGIVKPRP